MIDTHEYSDVVDDKPMSEEEFDKLVTERLHTLTKDQDGYLTISYESARDDHMYFVQTYSLSEITFHVEISLEYGDGGPASIYSKDVDSLEKTRDIFHRVLVEYDIPDYSDWDVFQKRVRDMDENLYDQYLKDIYTYLIDKCEYSDERAKETMKKKEAYFKESYYYDTPIDKVLMDIEFGFE